MKTFDSLFVCLDSSAVDLKFGMFPPEIGVCIASCRYMYFAPGFHLHSPSVLEALNVTTVDDRVAILEDYSLVLTSSVCVVGFRILLSINRLWMLNGT